MNTMTPAQLEEWERRARAGAIFAYPPGPPEPGEQPQPFRVSGNALPRVAEHKARVTAADPLADRRAELKAQALAELRARRPEW